MPLNNIFGSREDAGRPLIGEVCTVHLRVDFMDSDEPRLWSLVSEGEAVLREKFSAALRMRLGRQFEIRSVTFGRGSIEIMVVVAAIGAFIVGYGELRDGLDHLVNDMRTILRQFFGRSTRGGSIYVSGGWAPGPVLFQIAPSHGGVFSDSRLVIIMLVYILSSHALLLAFFMRMVLEKL